MNFSKKGRFNSGLGNLIRNCLVGPYRYLDVFRSFAHLIRYFCAPNLIKSELTVHFEINSAFCALNSDFCALNSDIEILVRVTLKNTSLLPEPSAMGSGVIDKPNQPLLAQNELRGRNFFGLTVLTVYGCLISKNRKNID